MILSFYYLTLAYKKVYIINIKVIKLKLLNFENDKNKIKKLHILKFLKSGKDIQKSFNIKIFIKFQSLFALIKIILIIIIY